MYFSSTKVTSIMNVLENMSKCCSTEDKSTNLKLQALGFHTVTFHSLLKAADAWWWRGGGVGLDQEAWEQCRPL